MYVQESIITSDVLPWSKQTASGSERVHDDSPSWVLRHVGRRRHFLHLASPTPFTVWHGHTLCEESPLVTVGILLLTKPLNAGGG